MVGLMDQVRYLESALSMLESVRSSSRPGLACTELLI